MAALRYTSRAARFFKIVGACLQIRWRQIQYIIANKFKSLTMSASSSSSNIQSPWQKHFFEPLLEADIEKSKQKLLKRIAINTSVGRTAPRG